MGRQTEFVVDRQYLYGSSDSQKIFGFQIHYSDYYYSTLGPITNDLLINIMSSLEIIQLANDECVQLMMKMIRNCRMIGGPLKGLP